MTTKFAREIEGLPTVLTDDDRSGRFSTPVDGQKVWNRGSGNLEEFVAGSGWVTRVVGSGLTPVYTQLGIGALSSSAQFGFSRTLTTLGTGLHGVEDWTILNTSAAAGASGYCSYDARVTMNNTVQEDHFAGFQARQIYIGAGGLASYLVGYNVAATHTGVGTIANFYGVRVADLQGTGPVTNSYGLYIDGATRGSVLNWSIFVGTGACYFGGPMHFLSGVTKSTTSGTVTHYLTRSSELSGFAALAVSFGGAATQADRVFAFQTVEQGIVNEGIIKFQPNGGTVQSIGAFATVAGAAKTAPGTTSTYLQRSTEATGYAALQVSFSGAALIADRVWTFQTVESAVGNDGIIKFQPSGGQIHMAGAFSTLSGVGKTTSAGTVTTYLQRSTDATGYAALQVVFSGAAAAADRVWTFQTVESGSSNAGIIKFQPNGGEAQMVGTFSTISGVAKTAAGTTSTYVQRSTDATGYAAMQVTFSGAAAAVDRVWSVQTIEAGAANDGTIRLQPSGGMVAIGLAVATTATTGFLIIGSCAGVPTGVPAPVPANMIPMIYDRTNDRIYFYRGSWRSAAAT
jgi:hypothetical protein